MLEAMARSDRNPRLRGIKLPWMEIDDPGNSGAIGPSQSQPHQRVRQETEISTTPERQLPTQQRQGRRGRFDQRASVGICKTPWACWRARYAAVRPPGWEHA